MKNLSTRFTRWTPFHGNFPDSANDRHWLNLSPVCWTSALAHINPWLADPGGLTNIKQNVALAGRCI